MERSIRDRVLEDIPIFNTLLVDEKGGISHEIPDDSGRVGITWARRSCTHCRASRGSVPSLKMRRTDAKPGTDWERITSSPGVPANDCSSWVVTSSSTSLVDMPWPSV